MADSLSGRTEVQLTTRDAEVVFGKLGIEKVHSSHHVRGYLVHNGVRVLALHYSFGRKAFPGRTSDMFRRSMHLTQSELREFVRCTISRDEYIQILLERAGLENQGEPIQE